MKATLRDSMSLKVAFTDFWGQARDQGDLPGKGSMPARLPRIPAAIVTQSVEELSGSCESPVIGIHPGQAGG
ncbi:hypothetical protein ACGFMK_10690 [Amycolatopsis sp. NPDC049252]|uniref:hypothetical protein n=1 Tax=Amycolatopsis sp. NPDC049252 TaxID=3363933 RepID=UPI003712AA18